MMNKSLSPRAGFYAIVLRPNPLRPPASLPVPLSKGVGFGDLGHIEVDQPSLDRLRTALNSWPLFVRAAMLPLLFHLHDLST
jgi:hypothetical protein